jgi:hypothetical protein
VLKRFLNFVVEYFFIHDWQFYARTESSTGRASKKAFPISVGTLAIRPA